VGLFYLLYSKYQQIKKKSKPAGLCWKSYNGPWLDLPSGKQTSKSTQKCVTEHKMKRLP